MNNTYISQMSVSGGTSDGENGCSCSDETSRGGFSVVKHGGSWTPYYCIGLLTSNAA